MKFGGSSVADAGRIRHVAGIVQANIERRPALVLSAMG
jgi:aspartate kinase